jgi:putative transposase
MMTPAMVYYGLASEVRQNRQCVLDAAYRLHPERFVTQRPSPHPLPKEVWINKPPNSEENSLNSPIERLKLVDTHR